MPHGCRCRDRPEESLRSPVPWIIEGCETRTLVLWKTNMNSWPLYHVSRPQMAIHEEQRKMKQQAVNWWLTSEMGRHECFSTGRVQNQDTTRVTRTPATTSTQPCLNVPPWLSAHSGPGPQSLLLPQQWFFFFKSRSVYVTTAQSMTSN